MSEYLVVHSSVVPEYLQAVLAATQGLKNGRYRTVSEATREVGISRSTYYKYQNRVFAVAGGERQERAVIALKLAHEAGVLSRVLDRISSHLASVLTISQAIPTDQSATVLFTLDITEVEPNLETLMGELAVEPGVTSSELISVG